jgi:2-methylcitrate dehydratase PrpD
MAHACDYDDSSWTMWGHPTAPVLPAVLAIAEHKNQSGLDFLVGLAAGLEIEKTLEAERGDAESVRGVPRFSGGGDLAGTARVRRRLTLG